MIDTSNQLAQISIDLKKYRIRVHKESLRLIGDPKYIQFLVNIDRRLVAIRAFEGERADLQAHRVDQHYMESDFSFEIYSKKFIKRLSAEFDCFKNHKCYRLTGAAIESEKVVVFPIDSLQKIDSIWVRLWKTKI